MKVASSGSQTFCATKPNGGGFIEEKMRPGVINWPITVRRWNMIVPISSLDFAMARRRPFLRGPPYEKSSPY
jgi:hypothetical protein